MTKLYLLFNIVAALLIACHGATFDLLSKSPLNEEFIAQQLVVDIQAVLERLQRVRYDSVVGEVKNNALSSEELTPVNIATGFVFEEVLTASEVFVMIEELKQMQYQTFSDLELVRQISRLIELFGGGLTDIEYAQFLQISRELGETPHETFVHYNLANKTKMNYESALLFAEDDYQMEFFWMQSRKTLAQLKPKYAEYITLYRKRAQALGYAQPSQMFYSKLEPSFEELKYTSFEVWSFYKEIHAYVRYQIQQTYGIEAVGDDEPIPQTFFDRTVALLPTAYLTGPFRTVLAGNPERNMKDADNFFFAMNMSKVPSTFWTNSAKNTSKYCDTKLYYAGAADEFSMSYCWKMNMEQAFEQFTSIQYVLQSSHLPFLERGGEFSNLDKAVGWAIALSGMSWDNVKKYIEVPYVTVDSSKYHEFVQWYYLSQLLYYLPQFGTASYFISSGLDNHFDFDDNCRYWQHYQNVYGIVPPRRRSSTNFDLYIPYPINQLDEMPSYIMEAFIAFQIYDALCNKTGATYDVTPTGEMVLSSCDFSTSVEAGEALKAIMSAGGSRKWNEVLFETLGIDKLSSEPMIKYFGQITPIIRDFNTQNNITAGWTNIDVCKSTITNIPMGV